MNINSSKQTYEENKSAYTFLCANPGYEYDGGKKKCVKGDVEIDTSLYIEPSQMLNRSSGLPNKLAVLCQNPAYFNLYEYDVLPNTDSDNIKNEEFKGSFLKIYEKIRLEHKTKKNIVSFEYISQVKCGSFGCVIKYRSSELNTFIAVKYSPKNQDDIKKEIENIKFLNAPGNEELREFFVQSTYIEPHGNFLKKLIDNPPNAIVMEYIDGTLADLNENTLIEKNKINLYKILLQIAKTFKVLDNKGRSYLDYKLENIFYRCNNQKKYFQIVFGDIGSICDKAERICPATIPTKNYQNKLEITNSDILWGIGMIMWYLFVIKQVSKDYKTMTQEEKVAYLLEVIQKRMYSPVMQKAYEDVYSNSTEFQRMHTENTAFLVQKVSILSNEENVNSDITDLVDITFNKAYMDMSDGTSIDSVIALIEKIITKIEKIK